jgi:hypothetical protein
MKNNTVSTASDNAKLPESMKQACCLICTLADAMKDCKACPFNAYRIVKSTWLVLDNDNPTRKCFVSSNNENDAMSIGASTLKTCNIRMYLQKVVK